VCGGGCAPVLVLTDCTIHYMHHTLYASADAGEPFLLYLPFNHIHGPDSCSEKTCGKRERESVCVCILVEGVYSYNQSVY
jgi:hypothetical protein